jgi:histidyl-tRNA synthetase
VIKIFFYKLPCFQIADINAIQLDKIGLEKVKAELSERSLTVEQINIIEKYLNISGTNTEKINAIKDLLSHSDTAKKGIAEIEFVISMVEEQSEVNKALLTRGNEQKLTGNPPFTIHPSTLTLDFTLARGLNYYTGIIFEAKAPASVTMGSIGGGGRYDDLTGLFGVPDLPGAGISFGVDRIYDVMDELHLFPDDVDQGTKILFLNLGLEESKWAFSWVQELRKQGIASEIFHELAKKDKQFKYAEKKNITFVAMMGNEEMRNNTCILKNIKTGEQKILLLTELCEMVKK